MRKLPPSGTPVSLSDLSFWLGTIFFRQKEVERFACSISVQNNVDHCFLLSTGRAAMALLLQCLAEQADPQKNSVIIPSYTCYSVPSSIVKAGLNVKVCDIDTKTLDYDYYKLEGMDFSEVLAIVSGNLYGIPNNLERLESLAREKNIRFIDDAAQSMGARSTSGRLAGTYGDAGIFSLDKGKVITSMNGGIIVTRSAELSTAIRSKIEDLSSPSAIWCMMETVKMLIYSFFLHPSRYWIPAALPFLKLGTTSYTTEYPVEKYNTWLSGLAHRLSERLPEINRIRIENGKYYRDNLPTSKYLRHIELQPNSKPIYLRYPIRITDSGLRSNVLKVLGDMRLGVTGSYPRSIVDIEQLHKFFREEKDNLGGKTVANQILTLPTHPFVSRADQNRIITLVNDILS